MELRGVRASGFYFVGPDLGRVPGVRLLPGYEERMVVVSGPAKGSRQGEEEGTGTGEEDPSHTLHEGLHPGAALENAPGRLSGTPHGFPEEGGHAAFRG